MLQEKYISIYKRSIMFIYSVGMVGGLNKYNKDCPLKILHFYKIAKGFIKQVRFNQLAL